MPASSSALPRDPAPTVAAASSAGPAPSPVRGLPPGPQQSAILQTARFLRDPFKFSEQCAAKYGRVFTIRLLALGPCVHVSDPELIRVLHTTPPDRLHAGRANRLLVPILGNESILVLDEEAHARMRRLVNQPLRTGRMSGHGPSVLDTIAEVTRDWKPGDVRGLMHEMQAVSLRVNLRVVFGVDAGGIEELTPAMGALLKAFTPALMILPAVRRDLGPWSPGGRFLRKRAVVQAWLEREFEVRRREADLERGDMLSLLLSAKDERGGLNDAQIRDQLITMLVAGVDTVSTGLAWCFSHVLRAPAVLERLRADVAALGPRPDPARVVELPYLAAICSESLRAVPNLFATARVVANEPLRLGEWTIPPGTYVSPNTWLLHQRPDLFSEPSTFRPERFLDRTFGPHEFMPFGGGARRCVGMPLGLYTMKLVLATLLSEWDMEPVEKATPQARMNAIVVLPSDGAKVTLGQRRSAPAGV